MCLKIRYNNISKQISIAQEEKEQVLISGDFIAKVGTYIEGNQPTVMKWGETIDENGKKYDLVIINKKIKYVRDYGIEYKDKEDQY